LSFTPQADSLKPVKYRWEKIRSAFTGKPVDSRQVAAMSLPKRFALPLFGSDGISSVAYAADEIILMLAVAGNAAIVYAPWVGLAVAVVGSMGGGAGAGSAYRVDKADELQEAWFEGARTVGLTSGASVPEILVRDVIEWLQGRGFPTVEVARTETESTTFALPRDLRADLKNAGMAPARPHAPRVAGPDHTS